MTFGLNWLHDQYIHNSPNITYTGLVIECLFSSIMLTAIYGKGIIIPISEIGKHVENGSLFQVHRTCKVAEPRFKLTFV